jgi:hypothetical protein
VFQPDLRNLNHAVSRAVALQRRADGVLREILPLTEYLDAAGEKAVWRVVATLREKDTALYNRFVGERFLRDVIVDIVVDHGGPIDFPELVIELARRADGAHDWLIAVPLANLLPPRGYVLIEQGAVALGMSVQEPDWDRNEDRPVDRLQMFRDLGDSLDAGIRWDQGDGTRGPLDTRMTAKLFFVQSGTETAAWSVAMTRTRLALALWCLLHRPTWREMWPTLGDWVPRPCVQYEIHRKLFQPGRWPSDGVARGRSQVEFGLYELPDDVATIATPFEVMRLAPDRFSARAAASAAWSLYLAERQPNDLELTDELVHLRAAIEAICDTGDGTAASADVRWARITERWGVWREMRAFYGQGELEDAKHLARDLRNIAQHGSDDVLVNLGYPPKRIRSLAGDRKLTGEQLGLARAAATVPVLRQAVRDVATRLVAEGRANGWDDEWFRNLLE